MTLPKPHKTRYWLHSPPWRFDILWLGRTQRGFPSFPLAAIYIILGILLHFDVVAADFSVSRGAVRLQDNVYFLDAHIDYEFSDKALEALSNGVPLTLDVHIKIGRKGAWIWEQKVLDRHLRFMIRYHALAQLYQVIDLDQNSQENFATRDAAITALGEINAVHLIEAERLAAGEDYVAQIRATLDIEALPLPLRPLAYLSPSWNLSSKWRKWNLEP